MKKKKIIGILLLFCVFTLTGCTTYVKDKNNKVVQTKEGLRLAENILCKPTDKETLKLYEENKVKIEKLPECEDMGITSKNYDGLWVTIFVQPLAWVIVQIGKLLNNYGLAIILTTLLIRLLVFPFTQKSAMQSENMKVAGPELKKLEKKYAGKNDQQSMMAKSQEMMMIYKKYDISPLSGCLFAFIQIPLFFAFLEAINRIPVLFEGSFLGLDLGMSPAVALFSGKLQYLILIALVIVSTYYSFKLNTGASMGEEQERQMKMMRNIMMVTMIFAAFSISSGIALYWVTSSIFTVLQNLLVKKIKVKRGVKHA